MKSETQKPFFHLGDPSIEYSTDVEFFRKEQIFTVMDNSTYPTVCFNSRLESKQFDRIKNTQLDGKGVVTEFEITLMCKEIHQGLMAGKFGKPTFVN